MKRNNKSGQAKRAKNCSHGKRVSMRDAIRAELQNYQGDFWEIKYSLASNLAAQYGVPIGEVNHMVEQEGRKLNARKSRFLW